MLLPAATAVVVLRQGPDPVPSGGGSADESPGGGPTTPSAGARTRGANHLLRQMALRLESGSLDSLRALAVPVDRPATEELGTLRANVRTLRMTGLRMHLVDTPGATLELGRGGGTIELGEGGAEEPDPPAASDRRWTGEVQVRWRLGADGSGSRAQVPFTFRQFAGTTRFDTARADRHSPIPLWMLDRVTVARTPRSLVVSADLDATGDFSRLADQAVVDVGRVLPRWRGRVVVEVPRHQRQLGRVLGTGAGTYAAIAAVTATADGSLSRRAPAHVFVNPRVFDPLGPRGSQIVMSHEATHVAMRAALSPSPLWLLEGFADYVALARVDVPVSRLAGQTLARVRRSGPPDRLPTQEDFGPRRPELGASYEAAWLACRLIAERYGEQRLVAFYRASDRAGATEPAFRTVLGTSEPAFTRVWRAELRRLARSTSG